MEKALILILRFVQGVREVHKSIVTTFVIALVAANNSSKDRALYANGRSILRFI